MKRIVSLLLVFVLCFCLCACSTTENSNTPSESQTPTTGTPPQGEVQGNSNPNDVSSEPSDSQDATEEVDPKVKALADFHDKYRIGTEMKLGESYNCCDLFEITPINFEFGAYAVDSTEIRVEHLGVWMQAKLTNTSGGKLDAQMINSVFPSLNVLISVNFPKTGRSIYVPVTASSKKAMLVYPFFIALSTMTLPCPPAPIIINRFFIQLTLIHYP